MIQIRKEENQKKQKEKKLKVYKVNTHNTAGQGKCIEMRGHFD